MLKLVLEFIKLLPTLVPIILELFRFRKPIPPDPTPVPTPEPVPMPTPTPEPLPPKDPKIYIPWKDREEWAAKVDNSYTIWRGDRDLAFLLSHHEVVEDLEFNVKVLSDHIDYMIQEAGGKNHLAFRIRNHEHPEFPDRSRVRKSVANEMIRHMSEDVTGIYDQYKQKAAALGVVWGVHFDSFQGFIGIGDATGSPYQYKQWKAARNG